MCDLKYVLFTTFSFILLLREANIFQTNFYVNLIENHQSFPWYAPVFKSECASLRDIFQTNSNIAPKYNAVLKKKTENVEWKPHPSPFQQYVSE